LGGPACAGKVRLLLQRQHFRAPAANLLRGRQQIDRNRGSGDPRTVVLLLQRQHSDVTPSNLLPPTQRAIALARFEVPTMSGGQRLAFLRKQ
jgi:hypothetical protein